jgi:adenylate kinase family enzyme
MSQRTIHITDELSLPLDIITMRIAEYGDSGSGKTAFARLLAERVYDAKHRFCAIDLKNDWWGLKSSADGTKPGIPAVIFGGPRADVKLIPDATAAETLADTIASIDQPAIIDLDAMSRRAQEKFLSAFLDRFYDVNRNPILVFCDEADRYAPQKPMTQEAIQSLSSSEDIARRGRKRGIGSCWLTQRTAVLNKNVSEFANLVIVFRTPGSKDLDELQDRVARISSKDVVKEVLRQAPGLEDGQAFFLSSHPKLRAHVPDPVRPVQLPLPRTFDSSATPSVGQRRREPKVLARADLAQIEAKLAHQVQQAKENDPAELRRKVVELQRELAAATKATPTPAVKEKRVEVRVLKDGQLKRAESILERLVETITKSHELAAAVKDAAAPVAVAIGLTKAPPEVPARPAPATVNRIARVMPAPAATLHRAGDNGSATLAKPARDLSGREELEGPEKRVLDSIAFWESIGIEQPHDPAVAFKAGYSPTSSAYERPRGSLRTAGLITFPDANSDKRALTGRGRELAQYPAKAGTLQELHAQFMNVLKGPEKKLLTNLINAYPGVLSNQELADASGYSVTSSAYERPRGKLRTLGLAEFRDGGVAATEILFPVRLMSIASAPVASEGKM